MPKALRTLPPMIALAAALCLVAALISGCGGQAPVSSGPTSTVGAGSSTTPKPITAALKSLAIARATLPTAAADARLYTVQSLRPVTPTASPEWDFVFVSPSTGKTWAAFVKGGLIMPSQQLPSSGLGSGEWSAIPASLDPWKIDSDAAYAKALEAVAPANRTGAYYLGMETYHAKKYKGTVEPFVWRVKLFPGASGETTLSLNVNATTGAASVIK